MKIEQTVITEVYILTAVGNDSEFNVINDRVEVPVTKSFVDVVIENTVFSEEGREFLEVCMVKGGYDVYVTPRGGTEEKHVYSFRFEK